MSGPLKRSINTIIFSLCLAVNRFWQLYRIRALIGFFAQKLIREDIRLMTNNCIIVPTDAKTAPILMMRITDELRPMYNMINIVVEPM